MPSDVEVFNIDHARGKAARKVIGERACYETQTNPYDPMHRRLKPPGMAVQQPVERPLRTEQVAAHFVTAALEFCDIPSGQMLRVWLVGFSFGFRHAYRS